MYIREKGATFNSLGYRLQQKTFHYTPPSKRIHETEKPVGLLRHLVALHTKEGDLVFDPYAGSFSTAVACFKEKRRFVGYEILGKYYAPAVKRLKLVTMEQVLF